MKTANMIEARDVTRAVPQPARHGDWVKREHIEDLLRRYPCNEDETAEIAHFLTKGSHLDVGLVSGSDELKEVVDRFRKENSRYFRLKLHEIAAFLIATAGPVGLLCWQFLS
jgi:hypothetical protein